MSIVDFSQFFDLVDCGQCRDSNHPVCWVPNTWKIFDFGPKNNMVSELLYDHCGTFGSIFKDFQAFQAFSSIFAVAQRAFTVGFAILKCSYLKICKM